MKAYTITRITFSLLILFLLGFDKNEDSSVDSIVNITNSESPFDLQVVNAKFAKNVA